MIVGGSIFGLALAWYHAACFGHPLINAQALSALPIPWTAPRWRVLFDLLFSSYRGLFFSSPVLLLALYGLWRLARTGRRREALVIAWVAAAFLVMNAAFRNWHGGACFGPRYLIPAVPFLALPLPAAFARWPRVAYTLATASVAAMVFATAVDPQTPRAVAHPFRDYLWPLASGRTVRSPVGEVTGPVSANPVGVYAAQTPFQARWNSFNLGEALWPQSWASLGVLLAVDGGLLLLARARLRRGRSVGSGLGTLPHRPAAPSGRHYRTDGPSRR